MIFAANAPAVQAIRVLAVLLKPFNITHQRLVHFLEKSVAACRFDVLGNGPCDNRRLRIVAIAAMADTTTAPIAVTVGPNQSRFTGSVYAAIIVPSVGR